MGCTTVIGNFNNVKAFVRKYGKPSGVDTLYFTGTHRADCRNEKMDSHWLFAHLLTKWNKKHAQAAYVSYKSNKEMTHAYRYSSPALLGEGTDFNRYLAALCAGQVIFDPGSKIINASTEKSSAKSRCQFRMSVRHLAELYKKFEPVKF